MSTHNICFPGKMKKKYDVDSPLIWSYGPVVQTIVSLKSLLMALSLTVVAKVHVLSNTLIFLLQKCEY